MANTKVVDYYFPYFRRGLGATLAAPEEGEAGKRASIKVNLQVEEIGNANNKESVEQTVQLYGPGDVLGFDTKRMVVKAFPTPNDGTFSPSGVSYIDFAEPDFLWRYSASKDVATGKHWIPWLTLIVLKAKEGATLHEFEEGEQNALNLPHTILLNKNAKLPELQEAWRWAHIHCNDVAGRNLSYLKEKIAKQPGYAVSRLLCARKLEEKTKYAAFIVPTYQLGLEAALGIEDSDNDRTHLSWTKDTILENKEIPYYFRWDFRTGYKGDFEEVARRIQPSPIKNLGGKKINIDNPGYGLLNKTEQFRIIEIDGALQSSDKNDEIPNPLKDQEVIKLAELLNSAEATDENGAPILDVDGQPKLRVVPPMYGRWINNPENADVNLDTNKRHTQWLEMLNLDLRYRIAAGLGVKYIKDNQEQLMEEAWQQLSKIQEENQRLNRERFGRAVSNCLHKRINAIENDADVAEFTTPGDTVITTNQPTTSNRRNANPVSITLRTRLNNSTIPNTVSNRKSRKYFLRRKAGYQKSTKEEHPFETLKVDNIVDRRIDVKNKAANYRIDFNLGKNLQKIDTAQLKTISKQIKEALLPSRTIESRAANRIQRFRQWERLHKGPQPRSAKQDLLGPLMAYPEFHVPMYKYLLQLSEDYLVPGIEKMPNNAVSALVTNRKFIEAFMMGLNHEFASELRWREFPTDLRGSYFRKFWDVTVYSVDENERKDFRESAFSYYMVAQEKKDPTYQMGVGDANHINDVKKIEAAFYEPQVDSNTGEIPKETIRQAKIYEEWIEKWLMTKENEKTIAKLNSWSKNSKLGTHKVDKPVVEDDGASETVLLIRADLLRKFPNTFIYLAQKNAFNQPQMSRNSQPIYPQFEANLGSDVLCLGFPVSEDRARRYFIVFEERGGELRFGLDSTKSGTGITDLSWEHFANIGADGYAIGQPIGNDAAAFWDRPAYIPQVFFQKPIRMMIDLNRLLP